MQFCDLVGPAGGPGARREALARLVSLNDEGCADEMRRGNHNTKKRRAAGGRRRG